MTLTAVEIEEGWVAQPCGCASHPGSTVRRDIGEGWTVVAEGYRKRFCEEHIDQIYAAREALRERLFGDPLGPVVLRST